MCVCVCAEGAVQHHNVHNNGISIGAGVGLARHTENRRTGTAVDEIDVGPRPYCSGPTSCI